MWASVCPSEGLVPSATGGSAMPGDLADASSWRRRPGSLTGAPAELTSMSETSSELGTLVDIFWRRVLTRSFIWAGRSASVTAAE